MTSRIIFASLVGILVIAPPAVAQVTVYGQVSGDSGVLEWAIVRWYGTPICDTTCAYGNWMLMNLPAHDSVRLEVWHQGYFSQTCWSRPGTCDFTLQKLPDGQVEQVGDFNLNGQITAADIVAAVGMVFRALPGPLWPPAADFNCDGSVTAADIIGQVNFVFKAGPPAPCSGAAGARFTRSASPAGC